MNRNLTIAAAFLFTAGLASSGCSLFGGGGGEESASLSSSNNSSKVTSSSSDFSTASPLPGYGSVVLVGSFSSENNYAAEGTARVIESKNRFYVALGDDFNIGRARSATLCFGNDGEFDTFTIFTQIEERDGAQVYRVPAGINPMNYNELYIWSDRRNGEVIGVARLD